MEKYDVASHGQYHLFTFKGNFYFFDIENMAVYNIPHELYDELYSNIYLHDFASKLPNFSLQGNHLSENEPGIISNISLNVAQVCNLSCVYCYGVDGEYGTKGFMTDEIAFKSVDFLLRESKNLKNISITFFGGEPLLNFPLIKKVVQYSLEKSNEVGKIIHFSITTNGTRFNDENIAFLNQYKFGVVVSFDGDKAIQDKNRPFKGGGGSFEATLPKIQKFLASRNGNATARATVTNHSVNLSELKSKLKKYGFKRTAATIATLSPFAKEKRHVTEFENEEYAQYIRSFEQEAIDLLAVIKSKDGITEYADSNILSYLLRLIKKIKVYYSCGVGRSMLGVSITGDLYPCHRFVGNEKFNLGKVTDHNSLSRVKYSSSHTSSNPICSKCWAKYLCGGAGCIHDNEITQKDVMQVNIRHCTELKLQVKYAIDILNNISEDELDYLRTVNI